MGESSVPKVCPKCGGIMVEGSLVIPMERMSSRAINELTPGFSMGGLPQVVEDFYTSPQWQEKTGKKTGLLFKRDEVRQLKTEGYRCSLCNYIEVYARSK